MRLHVRVSKKSDNTIKHELLDEAGNKLGDVSKADIISMAMQFVSSLRYTDGEK